MVTALTLLLALQAQAAPGPVGPGVAPVGDGWSFLNGIDVVVNERVMTHREVLERYAFRRYSLSQQDVTTEEELREEMDQVWWDRVHMFLEDQAGRDMGIDPNQVNAFLRRSEELRIENMGGIQAASEEFRSRDTDVTFLRDYIEEDFYASTWRDWQSGASVGPRGRVSRDRYVRPGVLKMLYQAAPTHYRKPQVVQLRQLILFFGNDAPPEQIEETEHLIVDLRDRILAGEDMETLVEAYGNTKPGTGGMTELLDEEQLSKFYPEIRAFLTDHPDFLEPREGGVGPISDVLPYVNAEGKHAGYLVVRLMKRVRGVDFVDSEIQAQIRSDRLNDLDEFRIDFGRDQLKRQAYVWLPRSPERTESTTPVGPRIPATTPPAQSPNAGAPTQAPAGR